ncbi:hypothetical protein F4813DRAFT_217210 [Daldinia decipiens]|uniref:uncharacterized protein n=1 Tax=Daldinia decipiens TaxID=326647 RepID=UPI0020C34941|nr:uncharacterized protein F4813DRAFT_217210 [Daldinia decipiens]KAI1654226.1 hypothetical protein F4813DRAFT_217210 [Daldinia decipiens]
MAINDGAKRVPETQLQQEDIPAYQNSAPSIFVPTHIDFTKPPPELPSEPSKRRDEILSQIDEHAAAVQDNIYYMLNREKTRIRQECKWREEKFPPHPRAVPGLTESQERSLPSSGMEIDEILHIRPSTSQPSRGDYEVPPDFTHAQCLHEAGRPEEPPRKSAEKMLMNLVKHGVQNLEGFAQHVKNVKEAKIKELENELVLEGQSSTEIAPADIMDTN